MSRSGRWIYKQWYRPLVATEKPWHRLNTFCEAQKVIITFLWYLPTLSIHPSIFYHHLNKVLIEAAQKLNELLGKLDGEGLLRSQICSLLTGVELRSQGLKTTDQSIVCKKRRRMHESSEDLLYERYRFRSSEGVAYLSNLLDPYVCIVH